MLTREHDETIPGFKLMSIYIPDEYTYVLGFSNCDHNSPTQIVKEMAELVLKNWVKADR